MKWVEAHNMDFPRISSRKMFEYDENNELFAIINIYTSVQTVRWEGTVCGLHTLLIKCKKCSKKSLIEITILLCTR